MSYGRRRDHPFGVMALAVSLGFDVAVSSSPTRFRYLAAGRVTPVVCIAIVGLIALAGCGSSKPAYCATRNDLQNSAKAIENSIRGLSVSNLSSQVSNLKAEFQKIQTNTKTLVSQVRTEFSSETDAIKSSVASLETAVKGLTSSPSVAQLGAVKTAASSTANSIKSFVDATGSKCG